MKALGAIAVWRLVGRWLIGFAVNLLAKRSRASTSPPP
jgi:hypothetical protein